MSQPIWRREKETISVLLIFHCVNWLWKESLKVTTLFWMRTGTSVANLKSIVRWLMRERETCSWAETQKCWLAPQLFNQRLLRESLVGSLKQFSLSSTLFWICLKWKLRIRSSLKTSSKNSSSLICTSATLLKTTSISYSKLIPKSVIKTTSQGQTFQMFSNTSSKCGKRKWIKLVKD